MVNKTNWDSDEPNKQNNLGRYLDSLSRHQQQVIKGISSNHVDKYLSLEEQDFLRHLKDCLTIIELSKLSKEEKQFRDRVIRETMAVWRRNKAELEQGTKNHKKETEQWEKRNDERAAKGWTPKHHELQPLEQDSHKKIYSVGQASRLHKGKDISVMGVISGIQPLRKMIKGVTVQCMKCNTVYERKYDKPEFFASFVPVESIRKCPLCKTGDYLGRYVYENINAVVVELKDHNTFSEIDPLRIIVFGDDEPAFDNTINIERHIGETIIATGDIYTVDTGRSKRESKVVAYLYVSHLIRFLSRQELELTTHDVKAVKRFVGFVGPDNVVERLTEMFATSIIGNDYVKKGLLLCAASTSPDKTAKKLHVILVGDPGLAKSELLKSAVKVVPNSKYESVQFATGKSLTAIVTKEEGDALTLRIGPIPQAKGAIAALNEIGRMIHEDQGLLLDTMQEQEFTTNKFGQNFHVDAPTAIIASANPVGGSWKSYESDDNDVRIDLDKIPMIKPLVDRFDLIFTFKDSRSQDHLMQYADRKSEMEDRPAPDYTAYIAKHILYAKQYSPKPKFSEEAKAMLNQYYVGVRASYGSPRILKTIYGIAANIARIKLKNTIDAADASETMKFYNVILQQLSTIVALPSNPGDVTYEECLGIIRECRFPIAFEEVIKSACENNPQVSRYLGSRSKLRDNVKLRPILEMLQNHSQVKMVRMKTAVLEYMNSLADPIVSGDTKKKSDEAVVCDPCDAYDGQSDTRNKNLQKNNDNHISEVSEEGSHTSHTSHAVCELEIRDAKERDMRDVIANNRENIYRIRHSNKWVCKYCTVKADRQLLEIHVCSESKKHNRASNPTRKSGNIPGEPDSMKPYEHLIETEYLPNLRQTVYRCKEHPDVPYYDPEGINESHFKPFHK